MIFDIVKLYMLLIAISVKEKNRHDCFASLDEEYKKLKNSAAQGSVSSLTSLRINLMRFNSANDKFECSFWYKTSILFS